MKIDGLTHPKTKELSYTLKIPLPHAIGLLELLWAFVAQQTPQGNVGKWSNAVIAGEAGWDKNPDDFVNALVSIGFLDENPDNRLLVHDWSDHAPNWVHAKLKKAGKAIISSDLRTDLSSDLRRGQDRGSEATTSLAKPSLAKPRQARAASAPDGPDSNSKQKATRIPVDWQPSDELRTWAETERPDLSLQNTIASFVDYWTAKAGKDATKRDWDATFRNWVRKETSNRQTGPISRAEATARYADEQFTEWERRYGTQ
jgi:hypothetical protein